MTPDKARQLLDNFDRLLPFEAELEMEGAAKDMAAMIAGMREEWGVSYRSGYTGDELTDWGYDTRDEAEKRARNLDRVRGVHMYVYGIVRRYVTTEEEIS